MKKVVLVGIMFLMFMGVVSASSINGVFEGNPIVKITSAGNDIPSEDVPAIIYKGRTVVPISMLKKLGADVTWDPSTYSANVDFTKFENDINKIKAYETAADYYNILHIMGDKFNATRLELTLIVSYLKLNINTDENINAAFKQVDGLVNYYNGAQGLAQYIAKDMIANEIYDTDYSYILSEYFESVDFFKAALEKLYAYKTDKDYASKYFEDIQKAITKYESAEKKSIVTYGKFHDLIMNYNKKTVNDTPTPTTAPTPTPKILETPSPTPTPVAVNKINYMLLYSNDGKTYLGKLTSNQYDSDSIFNDYGTYGGKYSAKSIYNDYGTYGGKYSDESAFNKYASKPPMILLDGKVFGYLTINSYATGAISPLGLKEFLISLNY